MREVLGWSSSSGNCGRTAGESLIPHIMPADSDQTSLYRLVLNHGDFGIHNMSITMDANGQPLVMSLYDWETGCIVPAILSDPLMAVTVDLVTDENAAPSITRVSDGATPDDRAQYITWARQYFKVRPSFKHCLSQRMKQRSNCLSPRRLSSIKRPITNVQSRQGKTHATFGLRCESGEVTIQRDISMICELGLRGG